jgi:predicted GNAT family acetyltransferase
VAALLTVQRRGFGDEHAPEATEADAEQFRRRFGKLQLFGAYLDGVPVSAGSLLAPYEGLSEVAGIATLPAYRGRGIAAALTAHIARAAFDQRLDLVFLTAGDARAGRVYERAGFRAIGSALAYVEAGG